MGGLEPSGSRRREKKRKPNVFTVAPIGRKKVQALFFSRKKVHLVESHHQGRPSRAPVNLGSTFGQPWVNVGSTLGNLRTYLGPIFADFARVSGETEGLHGVLIRNDQFSNRETAFSGFVLDQSPRRAPWEKKKRIPNVSTRFAHFCTSRNSFFLEKIVQYLNFENICIFFSFFSKIL